MMLDKDPDFGQNGILEEMLEAGKKRRCKRYTLSRKGFKEKSLDIQWGAHQGHARVGMLSEKVNVI